MRKILSVILLTLLFVACKNPNTYHIKGEVEDASWEGKQVTLINVSPASGMKSVDSTVIKNGAFDLKGKVDTAGWFVLLLRKEEGQPIYKDFYVEGDLTFSLKGEKARFSGGTINAAYQAFADKYEQLSANLSKLSDDIRSNPGNKEIEMKMEEEYKRFELVYRDLSTKTIIENMENPLGLHLFQITLSSLDNSDIEKILSKAGTSFLADPSVKMVVAQFALMKKVSVGNSFVELTMFKPDKSPISLSEYLGKGNYVLIDFWASWCSPCMREVPNLKACYDRYHKKGFEIVGVSLDEDSEKWISAIKANKMNWPQMSDLAGWNSQAVVAYSFSGIPHTVLVDPKGIIVEKDLRGEALAEKLSELYR